MPPNPETRQERPVDTESATASSSAPLICCHCGEACDDDSIAIGDKLFCCNGCKFVYELLSNNDMCQYYSIDEMPGITLKAIPRKERFQYLDEASVITRLVDFDDNTICHITFHIPQMHCSSCIWLLEHLYRLSPGVAQSKVNFLRKELTVTFIKEKISLRRVVELLASIGYEPLITLESAEEKEAQTSQKSLYIKIGVAGFCFGNIMLLSLPEYLAGGKDLDPIFRHFFGYLNLALSLPVLFYSAGEYFSSAWTGIHRRMMNIDVPIALGIITLFGRSAYEILSGMGAGYLDSFSGLVFFLLLGKFFQQRTYDALSFERDYKSYFPMSVTRKDSDTERSIPLSDLTIGDRMIIRNQELIPADSILMSDSCQIDYSFVTGESDPVRKQNGDLIYAGGRLVGAAAELEAVKQVSQSYLTRLWNNDAFTKVKESRLTELVNLFSRYFTTGVLLIATAAGLFWLPRDLTHAINAFTAVLIIACPCALALSTPFTLGTALRIFGRNKFYLKNTRVIETMARIDAIVLDKTGTVTQSGKAEIEYFGKPLAADDRERIKSLTRHSTHPLSMRIFNNLTDTKTIAVSFFDELVGQGITGAVNGQTLKIGSLEWVMDLPYPDEKQDPKTFRESRVHIKIGSEYKGYFAISNVYRPGLQQMIANFGKLYKLSLLSGDNDRERGRLEKIFPNGAEFFFNQSPHDKLDYIKHLQESSKIVMMLGDGLNDAGALRQSDVGIAVSEDTATFSPASDGILKAAGFHHLESFLKLSRKSLSVIQINFVISIVYNVIGLSFAVSGELSPVVSAILMPLSSITVVLLATGLTTWHGRQLGLWK